MILALAVSVNLRAATVNLGTVISLLSSVTVPTITTVLSLYERYQPQEAYLFFPRCLAMREIERGGLLTLDDTSLLRMVLAKAESVLLTRNLKSYTNDELK